MRVRITKEFQTIFKDYSGEETSETWLVGDTAEIIGTVYQGHMYLLLNERNQESVTISDHYFERI